MCAPVFFEKPSFSHPPVSMIREIFSSRQSKCITMEKLTWRHVSYLLSQQIKTRGIFEANFLLLIVILNKCLFYTFLVYPVFCIVFPFMGQHNLQHLRIFMSTYIKYI